MFAKDFIDYGLNVTLIELKRNHPEVDLSKVKRACMEEWTTLPDKSRASDDIFGGYMKELFTDEDEDVDIIWTNSQENPPQP